MKTAKYIAVSLILGAASIAGVALAQTVSYPAYPVYPTQNYCPQLTYNLYNGLSDYYTQGQVSQLQYFLGTYFAAEPVPVTGYFGPITQGFVARFQQAQGVYPSTGGVGPLTRAAIQRVCGGTVYPPPTPPPTGATFSASPASGQAPLSVTFSVNTQSGNASQYYIDFGDGSRGNPSQIYCFAYPCSPNLTAQHTYTQTGTYVARLYQDNNYCQPNMYCTLMYREPTFLGSVTINVTGTTQCPWWYPYCNNTQQSSVSVNSPLAGQTYTRGGQMTISWSGASTQNASTIVDLYNSSGGKVGTIAVQGGTSGSYTWNIPPRAQPGVCTAQFPNPSCLAVPNGQYYIKATLVAGNGFDNGSELASSQSGTFTINGGNTPAGEPTASAFPSTGWAPLTVTFTMSNYDDNFAVNFGDGTRATMQKGSVTHTYYTRGTYTASFSTDYACLHNQSGAQCKIGTRFLDDVTVTVY